MTTAAALGFQGLAVDGRRVPASDGSTARAVDPADQSPLAEVASAGITDLQWAVRLAEESFTAGTWRRAPGRERGAVLGRIADLVDRDREQLARIESRNAGKPIASARGEIASVATTFRYYAGAADKVAGQTLPGPSAGTLMTFREPLGVCGAILPWNFPLVTFAWKVAPALAMGNSVVVKPAELTPLSALALADLAVEAGLPRGVLGVVPGPGATVGDALVRHPAVRKISFTGSTAVGARVMESAAADITRVSLELGGKSASLVFADTDLGRCVDSSLWAGLDNAGQDCCARSRIFVQRPILDEFVARFESAARGVRLGPTAEESTQMGPLISQAHLRSVTDHVRHAQQEGARLLSGGQRPGGSLQRGNYLSPAVLVDAAPTMRIMQDEVFGPVVAIAPFDTEHEAVGLANGTRYGLSGSIWTRDVGRALRVARAVESGMLSVNSSSSVHIEAPFGGVKQSGLGREQGMVALDHYSELKTVFVEHS